MTMQMTLARPTLSGSQLARFAQGIDGLEDPFKWQVNPLAALAQVTHVSNVGDRRAGKRRLPASSLRGLGADYRYTGLGAKPGDRGRPWPVNPLGEQTHVQDWAMRRIDKAALPASSLRGLGADYRYTGLGAARLLRKWPINPLGETTHVQDWDMRRIDKAALPASSLRGMETALLGMDALSAIDSEVSVRDVQTVARKLGVCVAVDGDGRTTYLRVDGIYGPQTQNAMIAMSAIYEPAVPQSDRFFGVPGERSVRVASSWWHQAQMAAADRTDSCGPGGAAAPGSGGGGGGGSATPAPDSGGGGGAAQASVWSSPWLWGAAAIAAVAAGWWAFSGDEEGDLVEEY